MSADHEYGPVKPSTTVEGPDLPMREADEFLSLPRTKREEPADATTLRRGYIAADSLMDERDEITMEDYENSYGGFAGRGGLSNRI